MKYLLIAVLFPLHVAAQDWTRRYVATNGDTITSESVIKVNSPGSAIFPKNIDGGIRSAAVNRYMHTVMPGKIYKIDRLSRIEVGKKKYKNVAILSVVDPIIHRQIKQEFIIDIEEALNNKEIAIVK